MCCCLMQLSAIIPRWKLTLTPALTPVLHNNMVHSWHDLILTNNASMWGSLQSGKKIKITREPQPWAWHIIAVSVCQCHVSYTSPSCDPIMKSIISVILSIVLSPHKSDFSNKKLNMLPSFNRNIHTHPHLCLWCTICTMPARCVIKWLMTVSI